jgi:hypothetical protein
MGLCWSTTLPDDDEDDPLRRRAKELVQLSKGTSSNSMASGPNGFQGGYSLGGSFSKEEVRLRELLSALRTGLVFSPTEFSVLPGITTTAKVRFLLGSTELRPKLQDTEEEKDGEEQVVSEGEGDGETDDSEGEEEQVSKRKPEGPYELKLPLTGEPWTKGLMVELEIWPALGPFAGRKLEFHWREGLLRVQGCKKGEISVRELPESFESERDFCKCCLLVVYQQNTANSLNFNEGTEQNHQENDSEDSIIPSLTSLAYKVIISNLDAVPDSLVLPAKVYHLFFGSQSPVSVSVRIWPQLYATEFTASPIMHVKADILFSEFVYLLREHFHIPSHYSIKLYHNYKQLQMGTIVTAKHKEIDCFVMCRSSTANAIGGSYTSLDEEDEPIDSTANLVVSLVGSGMQNVQVDLGMSIKEFDTLLRSKFKLRDDSFLIIRSDDDFAPQYAADDNWKCTYPFSVPDSSFGAGLRRSFKRMSRMRGDNRLTQSQRGPNSSAIHNISFSPLMAKVVVLLSSNDRQFPSNSGKYGLSIQEVYDSMPMYRRSLDQCGIHPYSIVQVFEVTGPSIPITFRVVSDYNTSANDGGPLSSQDLALRTRLANIMDINPSWSVDTFLQYVDAIISPASGVRRKRLCLKESYIEDSDDLDLSEQTLRGLLEAWGPTWWPLEEAKRTQLTIKDIDPMEFLIVEKY